VGNPFPVAAPVSTSGLRESTGGWRDFSNTTDPVSIDECDLGYDSEGNAFPGPFYYVNFPDPYNITGWWFGVTPNDYQFLPWKAWFIYKEEPGVWRQTVPPSVP
jgi:hypothetical protein